MGLGYRALPTRWNIDLGRIDDQVKVRGFRIELGEIEAVLSQHPAVRETVVLAQEDVSDHQRLVAYVVAGNSQHLLSVTCVPIEVARIWCLPVFVQIEALPLTPNGKVDRQALPAPNQPDLNWTKRSCPPLPLKQSWPRSGQESVSSRWAFMTTSLSWAGIPSSLSRYL